MPPNAVEEVEIIDIEKIANFTEKQQETFDLVGKHSWIFAGGARGGGKSHLIIATAVIACLLFPGLRVMVIRRSLEELRQQLIDNLLLRLWRPGELFRWFRSSKTARFENGSVIYFRSIEHPEDVQRVLGVEFGLVLIDEGNQFPWMVIKRIAGSVRQFNIPNWKPTIFMTGNPGGIADREFKDYFIRPRYDRWTPEEIEIKDEFAYVFFNVHHNPYATEEYKAQLNAQPEAIRRQWLFGDWDGVQGQFFENWNPLVHVIPAMDIPQEWVRFRGVDLGYGTHDSVCLFAAQSPNGDVYVYREVATKDTTDTFAKMCSSAGEGEEFASTWFDPNSMKGRRGETGDALSPAEIFAQEGIYVEAANNERQNGWRNIKAWLNYEPGVTTPKLYIFEECTGLIETIPIQQYVNYKHDLNTRGQDDYVDALRYLMSHIPYGSRVNHDGTVEAPEGENKFGTDRRPDPISQRKKLDLFEPVERDGITASIYAHY